MKVTQDYIEHFQRRVLTDALTEASATQWRKRASTFREARPREGDFHGQSTLEERRERWRRLSVLAASCEAHARLLESDDEDPTQVVCPVCGTPASPWSCSCGQTRVGEAA